MSVFAFLPVVFYKNVLVFLGVVVLKKHFIQVCASIFHPRADGPFPLSLPLFLGHKKNILCMHGDVTIAWFSRGFK